MMQDLLMVKIPFKNNISSDELKELAAVRKAPCVSIFLSAHQGETQFQQNAIRFKNLVNQADRKMRELGADPFQTESLLRSSRALLEETPFWIHQKSGIAVLLAEDFGCIYALPEVSEEIAVVGSRFHLKPFFPLFTEEGGFCVLALSQNQVRFFEANRDRIREINLKTIPKSLEETLHSDGPARQSQFRTGPSSGRSGSGIFYDQGSSFDDNKDSIQRYFQQVERGVTDWLRDRHDPLLLMGVEYLLPLYHGTNRYPGLLPGGIEGNPDGLRPNEIHDKAWSRMRGHFQNREEEAGARYRQLAGEGRQTSSTLTEILTAAWQGRIQTLFLDMRRERWGRYVPMTGQIFIHPEVEPGDEDLFNAAGLETFLHRGTVFPLEPGDRISPSGIAATFRY